MEPSIQDIEDFLGHRMEDAAFIATQKGISAPKIRRNLLLLQQGEVPLPIEVVDDMILEGHHRFVAGCMYGSLPATQPGIAPHYISKTPWKDVKVDAIDWDHPATPVQA